MKQESHYCISCGRNTLHRSYCEEDTIEYNGVEITYTDKGFICEVCGDTYTPPAMYDEIMQEIRDSYREKHLT